MSEDINTYSIMDLEGYAESIRKAAAESFVDHYNDNLNDYITINQTINIIVGYSLGQDEEGNYLVNEEVFNDTFEDIRDWIFHSGLSKLAAKNLIECAWDDNSNEMIFWLSKDEKQSKPSDNRT